MALGRRLRGLVPLCLAVLFAGGCGGGGDTTDDDAKKILPDAPTASQPFEEARDALLAAIRTTSCSDLERIVHSQYRSESAPGAPLTASECRALQSKFRPLRGFAPAKSQQFQTGAVLDGKLGGRSKTVLFALDSDRRWKFVVLIDAAPQAGRPNKAPRAFDRSAASFILAFRNGDCRKLARLVSKSSPHFTANRRAYCRALRGDPSRPGLAYELRRDPQARPRRLGTTRDFGFYGLPLASGRYDTVIMATQPRDTPARLARTLSPRGFYETLSARSARRGS